MKKLFESLPKPIFYKILSDFDTKEVHRLLAVSKYFNQLIKSDEFWVPRINTLKITLMSRHEYLNEKDAALFSAALFGLTHYVQKYIDQKANVNAKLFFHKEQNAYINPLHHAAHSGNMSCVMLLINNQATFLPEDPMEDSDTPLHFAVSGGSFSCAKFFLVNGVPVDHATKFSPLGWNRTALQVAAAANKPRCCELLIQHGANVHHKDPDEFQAIHRASSLGNLECLKILLKHEADVNASSEDGITPLTMAISNHHLDCVRLLLAHGANPRVHDILPSLILPLQKAIVTRQFDLARILLEYDSTLIDEIFTYEGQKFPVGDKTALHLSAINGDVEAINFLLAYNPDPECICFKGKTAIEYAQENGHEQCVELLYDYMIEREFTQSCIRL